jgi:hypothetical protein
MELCAFFESVQTDPELKGIAICQGNGDGNGNGRPAFIVEHVPSRYQTRIPFSTVQQCDWRNLREVICGQREPNVLYQMARIVGYYSRVENWNRSKIGELNDRHRGNYKVA